MSKDWFQDIVDFHRMIGRYPIPFRPHIVPKEAEELRRELVREEVAELFAAMSEKNLPKIADGIVDSIVVLLGTAVEYGMDIRPIWNEVHKTNMAKADGPVREDGKKLKPEGWKPPNIEGILAKQKGEVSKPEDIDRAVKLEINNTRLAIVGFLEKQLFRNEPVANEVCRLTYDMWGSVKESILKGEYGRAA